MTARVFVDSNVLIYARELSDPKKQKAAEAWLAELWRSGAGRISYQVLQEFYVTVLRKVPSTRDHVRADVRDFLAWRPVPVSASIIEAAWKLQDRFQLSFRDALIVSAAKATSCKYLLTEDLQAGQDLGGILVINPFTTDPAVMN